VIDSLSFPVFPRLFFFSIASGSLYFLASRHAIGPFEATARFFAIWAALFLLYGLAIRAARARSGRTLVLFIFVTSALFRATFLIERKSSASGESPSPMEALMGARPELETIGAAAFDLAGLALMPALLRGLSLPTGLALVYGWNPLLVLEGARNGRTELIPLFFLLLACLLLQRKSPGVSAVVYGASLAGPPLFWATLPLAARALGPRLVFSLLLGALAWAPIAAERPLAELLGFPPSEFVGGSLLPAVAALAKLFVTRDPRAPLLFCASAFLLLALLRTWKLDSAGTGFPRECLILIGGFLFLSPQVRPWSFVPIAGLAAFSANPGWIVATATAPLTYLALGAGSWNFWLAFAQYFPVYASLAFVALGAKRDGKGRPGKAK
jgi:hypothetical protein